MALSATKEQVMNAISSLGFEVFRNGSFHWQSENTPDMQINNDGSIHCWTTSPFNRSKSNHGDLIDFIQLAENTNFNTARERASNLLNLELPPLESYNGYFLMSSPSSPNTYISETFYKKFEKQRAENFDRYKELLSEALPSLNFAKQKEIAQRYQIGYIKQSDRLVMPIRDEQGNILTLWKYNKNAKEFKNAQTGLLQKAPKVLFSRGKKRTIFNLSDLIKEYSKDKSNEIYLCAGEKDVLNMVGNGYRAITLGSENSRIPSEQLSLFKGLNIVIAYDYDKAGFDGTIKALEQLNSVVQGIKIWNWEDKAKKHNIKLFEGFDMSDFLTEINTQNKTKAFKPKDKAISKNQDMER